MPRRFPLLRAVGAAVAATAMVRVVSSQIPDVGSRIRVQHPCASGGGMCGAVVGVLAESRGDTLTISTARHGLQRVLLTPTSQLEISRGRHRHPMTGLGIGAAAVIPLLAIGDAVGKHAPDCDEDDWVCILDRGANDFAWGLNTLIGAPLLGFAVGYMIQTDQWERVVTHVATIRPMGGGLGLGVRLAF